MKRIFGLITVLATLALGTSVFANGFTAGNIVVYRMGDGSQPVTNLGQNVFLDEYSPAGIQNAINGQNGGIAIPVQSIMMPTNWVGNQAPLIADGAATQEGLMTLSVDGRYLVVPGFGASVGQLTNLTAYAFPGISSNADVSGSYATNPVTEADVPRVVGLVDGNGHIYTTTVQTNGNEDGDDIRSAASLDGTNIWLAGGDGLRVKYTTRGSMVSTQVCANTSLEPARAMGIFSNALGYALYMDKNVTLAVATNTTVLVNPYGGTNLPALLPTSSIPTNFVPLSVGPLSAQAFAMFRLQGGSGPVDTLYLADSTTNFPGESRNYGGAVLKFCNVSGSWVYQGAIGAEDAYGVAGIQNGGTVSLYITEGTNAAMYYYQDTSGYNNPIGNQNSTSLFLTLANTGKVNVRGVALAPQGGDSGTITSAGSLSISVGPPYGPYFHGPQGGPFNPTNANAITYSVANLGSATTNFTVQLSAFAGGVGNWVTVTPSSGTLTSGASTIVTVTANTNATNLNGGVTYTGNLLFHTGGNAGAIVAKPVATIVVDAFYVTPTTNFISVGEPGGPFTPSSTVYTLSNSTPGALSWSVFTSNIWTSLSAASGSLPGKTATNITVSINSNANSLAIGTYNDQVVFSNVTASSQIATAPSVYLQVGFGIFDDFSTYVPGNVVGQNNWNGSPDDINPVQIVTVNGTNEYVVPGGCVNANGTSQQPYKYVAAGPVTNAYNIVGPVTNNVPTYAIMGMTITFTNAPSSANYVFALDNVYLPWNNAGIESRGGNSYSWTTELDRFQTGGGPEGSPTYTLGTQYQVYLVSDFVESNAWVFVNPGTNDFATMMSQTPAVHSDGMGADACPSADCIGNAAQGWEGVIVGQYSACPGAEQPGYLITRLAASTNYADVYAWLNPPTCSPPTASFTPASASGAAPLSVQFTDASTTPVGTITAWSWTFGDGGTSASQNPLYTYTSPGTYTASLSATNSCGLGSASPATATISVYDPYSWWRLEYFGSTNGGSGAPGVDVYGTGMSNTNKFLAGFSGTNSAAYLHIISVVRTNSNTDINVTYRGASGDSTYTPGFASRTNILEYSAGTGNGSYTNNFQPTGQTNILSGGSGLGTVTNMTDSGGATNVPSRYYRVRVLLP